MATRLSLRRDQLDDLKAIRDLGSDALGSLVQHLRGLPEPLLKPDDLRDAVKHVFPDQEGVWNVLVRQLLSLYHLRRQARLNAGEVLEGLRYGLTRVEEEQRWSDDEVAAWDKAKPQLEQLLALDKVWVVAKAADLAYEYANLLQDARIITDIRPVFDQDGTAIEAAVVSFTLRLYYDNREGDHSLSVALDENDIRNVINECNRARAKAKTAKERMLGAQIATSVSGT